MKAIGYVRVSTDEQAREGVSLEAQRAKIEQHCSLYDVDLIDMEQDAGISGKKMSNREGLQRAMARIEKGEAEALVVLKLDRLSRSTRDVLEVSELFQRRGWTLHSINERLDTSTATGRFVLTILAALAQMEREQVAERNREVSAYFKRIGRWNGGHRPYGWNVGPEPDYLLTPNEEEQEALDLADRIATFESYAEAARELNRRHIPTAEGKRWDRKNIRLVLMRYRDEAHLREGAA